VSSEAYARQLKQLLPSGRLLRIDPAGTLSKLLLGVADELARLDARAVVLVSEWDPSTADELLADWERVLGLPAPGTALPAALADRQANAARAYVARGGQSYPYFYELAALAGFVVVIDDVAAHVWRMTVDLAQARVAFTVVRQEFRAGAGRAGDRISSVTVPELEAPVRRAAPAHTVPWFLYLNAP
jgi:uncharacterized protein YmfQ (DUF2313 family)